MKLRKDIERYRLKKDLPTFKKGDEFIRVMEGPLVQIYENGVVGVCAYAASTLEKFPNILEDWFEPIEEAKPLIKDEKIRKAVRAWAEACDVEKCHYDGDGDFATRWHGIKLDGSMEQLEEGTYTIAELCGEEDKDEA